MALNARLMELSLCSALTCHDAFCRSSLSLLRPVGVGFLASVGKCVCAVGCFSYVHCLVIGGRIVRFHVKSQVDLQAAGEIEELALRRQQTAVDL